MKIFNKKIAEDLIRQGFSLIRSEVNRKRPKYLSFIFDNSPELFEYLKKKYDIVAKEDE